MELEIAKELGLRVYPCPSLIVVAAQSRDRAPLHLRAVLVHICYYLRAAVARSMTIVAPGQLQFILEREEQQS
jgi:hypothetical protein